MQVSCAQGAAGGGGSHQRLELPPPHCCGVAETLPQGPAAQHGVLSPRGHCRRAPAYPVTAPWWWQDLVACCTCGQVCSNPAAYPLRMLETRGPGLACKTLPSQRRAACSTSPTVLSIRRLAGCLPPGLLVKQFLAAGGRPAAPAPSQAPSTNRAGRHLSHAPGVMPDAGCVGAVEGGPGAGSREHGGAQAVRGGQHHLPGAGGRCSPGRPAARRAQHHLWPGHLCRRASQVRQPGLQRRHGFTSMLDRRRVLGQVRLSAAHPRAWPQQACCP